MSKNSDEHPSTADKRARLEDHILDTFHEQRVLFEEGRIRFHAVAHLTCDAWGVSVRLDVEVDDESVTVSGAWDVIVVRGRRMGAAYVGGGIVRLLDGEDEPGEGNQRFLR